jgi:hypothetical protein
LEVNQQVIERQTEDNFKNGEEYAGLTETLILKSYVGHMSFENKRKAYEA